MSDADILAEARKRFEYAQGREAASRNLAREDIKFASGDSDNGWQWPSRVWAERLAGLRPSLTINKTRQHCLQIVNDLRNHKQGVVVRPAGGDTSYEQAETIEGIVRHIEYRSNALQAYETALWFAVHGGFGYWRVTTDYAGADTFDQEISVVRIKDPFSVYLDPDIQEFDGSDANWGIVFVDVPRAEAVAEGLIKRDDFVSAAMDGGTASEWSSRETVRRAEYFRRTMKRDTLVALPENVAAMLGVAPGSGARLSEMPQELRAMVPPDAPRRDIATPEIEWFDIVGERIARRRQWPGKYIPIVRVIGEETLIDGVLDRKGHVRALKDPQRMMNYNSSASVEFGALQSKAPYVGPAEAFEGFEEIWRNANTDTMAFLPYRSVGDDGKPIPAPQRQQPPTAAPVFLEGVKLAQSEMMLASGQYQAVMGQQSNETSGVAIDARQRQGDNATAHYGDHLATAIRFTGKILIDLIPRIYDTRRVVAILARDGKETRVQIDPEAPQGYARTQDPEAPDFDKNAIAAIFNPTLGEYDVMSDVGPSYLTQRQQAFAAFQQIVAHNPALTSVIGDLMFKAADFPMSDEIAERLRKMVPAQAMGGPSPEVQQLMAHAQQMAQQGQQQIEALHAELQKAKDALADKQASELDWFKAETERLRAAGGIDPEALKPVIRQLVSEVLDHPVVPVMHAHALAEQAMRPQPQGAEAIEGAEYG